jgi:hypothetical protein
VLRANLHAATLGLVTPAVDQDQQPIDHSTSDRQRLRRRHTKKSDSNKKKVRREKRNKKHKRSRHKKVRSPDQGDDSSLSSDSLSSSSSSEVDYTSSSDDSCRSILAFGDHGSTTNIRDIKNDKERRQTSTRVGKEIKKLVAAAKTYELKAFFIDRGTIDRRKCAFTYWASTLREMLTPIHRYNALMRDYPRLDRSELTVTANTALGLFFRMKLKESGMHIIEESIGHENKDNGCMILSYLINHYGNITDIDVSKAKERWEQTLWNNKDTMDSYAQRFTKRLSVLREAVLARPDLSYMLPTKGQATKKFLLLLVTSLPKTHGMRASIQAKHANCQTDMATYGKLNTNIATWQFEFFQMTPLPPIKRHSHPSTPKFR